MPDPASAILTISGSKTSYRIGWRSGASTSGLEPLRPEALSNGHLFQPGSIEAILRERLASARVAKMQATRQKLSATATPPMTAEEIEAEIQAYRAERRRAAGAWRSGREDAGLP